jgi:hypothetical protein
MTEKEKEIVINNEDIEWGDNDIETIEEDDYASFSYVFEIIENIIEEREHSAEENVEDDGIEVLGNDEINDDHFESEEETLARFFREILIEYFNRDININI